MGATPFWTPVRFPGQYYDWETGLAENWNRFYDASVARYGAIDPIGLASPKAGRHNPYVYANGNPMMNIDPTGGFQFPASPVSGLDMCPNYTVALDLAQEKAGCDSYGAQDSCNDCQQLLHSPKLSGCDVCAALQDGSGPLGKYDDLNSPLSLTKTYGQTTFFKDSTGRIRSSTAFDVSQCFDPAATREFAGTLFHEALHTCLADGPSGAIDPGDSAAARACPGCPNASDVEDKCFGP
jgi:RHS repeat-associated protein